MKSTFVTFACATLCGAAVAQGSMGPVIGFSQGWPPTSEGHAVHMVHIAPTNLAMGNKGRLLFWGSMTGSSTQPRVWDPYGGGTYGTWVETASGGELNYDMYCCGQTLLSNGKVITTGSNYDVQTGVPNNRVSVFDPATDTWDALSAPYWMNKNRYYPTTIRMPYGEIVSAGGMGAISGDPEIMWIRDGPFEYIKPTLTGQADWTLGTDVSYDFVNYPHIFPLSATEVFFPGPARHNTNGGNDYNTFSFPLYSPIPDARVPMGGASDVWEGSCSVMIRPRAIFKAGGYSGPLGSGAHPPASNRTEYLPLNSDETWTTKATMHHARIDFNLVLGPDGLAYALGGSTHHGDPASAVYPIEIYNLATNTWTIGPSTAPNVFRGYHSTAVLLPDGRIPIAGSDNQPVQGGPSAQIYSPAYCFGGTRPNILTAPDVVNVGASRNFSITVDDAAVNEAVLMGLGAVTHGFDSNQRYIPLTVTGAGTTKSISTPLSLTDAPTGLYMLFVLKPNPSGGKLLCNLAKYVKVETMF